MLSRDTVLPLGEWVERRRGQIIQGKVAIRSVARTMIRVRSVVAIVGGPGWFGSKEDYVQALGVVTKLGARTAHVLVTHVLSEKHFHSSVGSSRAYPLYDLAIPKDLQNPLVIEAAVNGVVKAKK